MSRAVTSRHRAAFMEESEYLGQGGPVKMIGAICASYTPANSLEEAIAGGKSLQTNHVLGGVQSTLPSSLGQPRSSVKNYGQPLKERIQR